MNLKEPEKFRSGRKSKKRLESPEQHKTLSSFDPDEPVFYSDIKSSGSKSHLKNISDIPKAKIQEESIQYKIMHTALT